MTGTEPVVLRTPAQFRALGHPLRHRLLIVLRQRPATPAQLGAALGVAKGTAGYHLKVLADAGLVTTAGTRTVRGGTEHYFAPAGPVIEYEPGDPRAQEFLFAAALAEAVPAAGDESVVTLLRHVRLTPAAARALLDRVRELHETAQPGAADGAAYGLLLSLYRADIPALPPDTGAERARSGPVSP
jgi:DNA-binding transcriptional ArsR family regulator